MVLVFDTNNLFHKNYHVNKTGNMNDFEDDLGMAIMSTLDEMKHYYYKYKPSLTIAAFDGDNNWRKTYTLDKTKRVSDRIYKQNRKSKKTERELEEINRINEKITEYYEFLKDSTKLLALRHDILEADDIASEVVRRYGGTSKDIKIVTSDKDYLQFCRYSNVEIINPLKGGKDRNLKEWNNDADLFLFEKCIRGDAKDNVRSSYPRLRKTKLVEAFYDDYKRSNVLNHTFKEAIYDEEKDEYIEVEYNTSDLFNENMLLLNLDNQPEHVKETMTDVFDNEMKELENTLFNFVQFLKFCRRNEILAVLQRAQTYVPFLSAE